MAAALWALLGQVFAAAAATGAALAHSATTANFLEAVAGTSYDQEAAAAAPWHILGQVPVVTAAEHLALSRQGRWQMKAAVAVAHFDSVEMLQNGALLSWCLEQLHFLAGIEMRSSMYLQTSTERL